jgi:cyclopropane fatty-acyl-phospholipid synthase-like methyltransferase
MDEHQAKVYQRLVSFYATGSGPWDDVLPPPEVMALLEERPVGRALDLGCGYGRASIYMAGLGWEVDGVDFVAHATAVAAERAREAGVEVRFHIASVTDLGFLAGPYDFVLDVGCVHALDEKGIQQYQGHLKRLLRGGGDYLLYVRLKDESEGPADEGPKGVSEMLLRDIFGDGFELEKVEKGITEVEGMAPWQSGWFYFRRLMG